MTLKPDFINENMYQGKPMRFEVYKNSFSHIPIEDISQVYACVTDMENKILIVHNTHGDWGLPGGAREDGETCLQALQREVYEESAVVLDDESIEELFYQIPFRKVGNTWEKITVQVRYKARVKHKDIFVSDPAGGVDDVKWVSFEEFPTYVKWGDTASLITTWMREN